MRKRGQSATRGRTVRDLTTGLTFFAECLRHSVKAILHSANNTRQTFYRQRVHYRLLFRTLSKDFVHRIRISKRFYTQEHRIDRLSRFVHVKHNMNRTYPYFWHLEKSISFIICILSKYEPQSCLWRTSSHVV
jgi:hypothetical protein